MWQKAVGSRTWGSGLCFCEGCLRQPCMSSGKRSASSVASSIALTEESTTLSSDGIEPGGMLRSLSYRLSTAGGICLAEALRSSMSVHCTAGVQIPRYVISISPFGLGLSRVMTPSHRDIVLPDEELSSSEGSDEGRSGIEEGGLWLGRAN